MTYQTKHPPRLRFISAVLSLAMLLTLLPTTAFAAVKYGTEGDYEYYDKDGVIGIRVYNGTDTDVVIPDTLNGKPVKILATGSFQRDKNMVSVWIPASVTEIGNSAFYNLTSLKTVTFAPGSQLEMINGSFSNSGVTTIELPDSLKIIGKGTFMHCHGLKSMTIPSSVEIIGENAFYNCRNLKTISIPASVTSIEKSAFGSCSNLETIEYEGTEKKWKELTNEVDLGIASTQNVTYNFKNVRETATVTFDLNLDSFGIEGEMDAPQPQTVPCDGGWDSYASEPGRLLFGDWCTTGWYTDKEGAKNNDPAKEFVFGSTKITKDITLYARWTKDDQLSVGNVAVTAENRSDVLGDGTVQYDPGTHTLTLKDAEIHGDSADHKAIRYTAGYGSLTVKGSATLYGDVGIDSQGTLNIEDADLTFRTETTADTLGSAGTSSGFMSYSAMTIRNSTLKIESAAASGQGYCVYPYFCSGNLRIENSTVSVDDNVRCDYGLSAQETLTISDSRVTIPNARVQGIASEGDMTLSGADTWVVAENAAEGSQYPYDPIWSASSITRQDGLEFLEDTTQNGVKRMVVGNRTNQVFTVTFTMNGHGTQEPAQQVKYGTTPKAPAIPEAEGWYFVGWYADEACTEAAAFGLPIQKDTTYYAKWVEKTNQQPYKVHFDLNASDAQWEQNFDGWGEWDDAHRVVTAETYSAYHNTTERLIQCIRMELVLGYAQPEREGYTFKGWYTAPEDGEKMEEKYDVSMGIMGDITEDRTFYAQWEKIGGEPSNPDKPTEPSNPDKPTEPSNPDKPTEPSNPDKPTEPSNPDKPTEPSNPDKPSTPEDPEQPTTPSEPSKDGGGAGTVILLAGGAALLGGIGYGVYTYVTETQIKALLPEGTAIPANRGELAILLWNAAGRPEPAALPAFADVSDPELAKAAAWCIASGRMTAQEDGTFAPEQRMWKHQVLEVLKAAPQ